MNEPLAQDKQELIREVAEAALLELDKMEKRYIHVSSPRQVLEQLFKGLLDPQPVEEKFVEVHALPVAPPDFPCLLRSLDQKEYIIVNNFAEWAHYHEWEKVFPPPGNRKEVISLEAELEKLKAGGVEERLKQDWERRKQKAEAARK